MTSYEEYHPFGTSSHRAADSSIEVSPKRYRYIGKERDEETGLDHMGARYYAPWFGRWTRPDPLRVRSDLNRYQYVNSNPVRLFDPDGQRGVSTTALSEQSPLRLTLTSMPHESSARRYSSLAYGVPRSE